MRLTRYFQKIFGSTGGPLEFGKFGSLAAGTAEYGTTPSEMQSLSNFDGGWFAAILGNNKPAIEDMNALFYIIFYQIAYNLQLGVAEWNELTTYYIGSVVQDGTGQIYVSISETNLNQALTVGSKWVALNGKITQFTTSQTLTSAHQNVEFDCTGGDRVCTLPAAASNTGKRITITKTDTSTNVLTFVSLAQALQLEGQYDSITVLSNGTVWYSV